MTALACHPHGHLIATKSRDHHLRLHRSHDLTPVCEIEERTRVASWGGGIAFTSNGVLFSLGDKDTSVRCWRLPMSIRADVGCAAHGSAVEGAIATEQAR